jgi:hypothetical protein
MKVALAFNKTPSWIANGAQGPLNQLELGVKWLEWVAELPGTAQHELVILVPADIKLPETTKAWKNVIRLHDRNNVAMWPTGPNLSIQQILWWQFLNKLQEPVFWMESDAIPLKPYWIDAWRDEYESKKKPFMGSLVPAHQTTPEHMSGVGIYPPKSMYLAPRLFEARGTAFDVYAANQIVPLMHQTRLYQHIWRHPPITTMEEYSRIIDPKANIFHSDKFGALIDLMRAQRNGQVAEPEAAQIIRKAFGTEELSVTEEAPKRLPVLSAVTTEEDVYRLILEVIKTEEQRIRLIEFLRDNNFLFLNFGRPQKRPEPPQLAKYHGRG